MEPFYRLMAVLTAAFGLTLPGAAYTLVDDTWAEGSRKEQNLPASSAWFASNRTNLATTVGTMTILSAASSRQFITYFPVRGEPIPLAHVGDSVIATLTFRPWGAADENHSRNFRLGLFDSSAKRLTADGLPTGSGIKGYALFLNFGRSFGTMNAVQIGARTNMSNTDLMGSSSAYATLTSAGQPINHSVGFTNGGLYTLRFSVKRAAPGLLDIRTVITGGGLNIMNTASDSDAACTNFDTCAIRTSSVSGTAEKFEITEFKVEGPVPLQTPNSETPRPKEARRPESESDRP